MPSAVAPHLNFRRQARAALDFYKNVFEGEQVMMTYAAMGQENAAESPGHVIWRQIASDDGFRIMAFDVQAGREYDAGANAFSYLFVARQPTRFSSDGRRWARARRFCTTSDRFRGHRYMAC